MSQRKDPGRRSAQSLAERKAAFADHVRKAGLRATRQRDRIVDVFLRSAGHLSIEELLDRVRKREPRISPATVYRTVHLLEEAGLADRRAFEGRQTRYEASRTDHHDHLICTECGRIDEFEDDRIERLQEAIAAEYGYAIATHRHEIYGTCPACGGGRPRRRTKK